MVVSLKKVVEELKINTTDLITRQMGRKIFETINEKLKLLHDNEVLLLDFDRIRVIDSSFIDELIIKIIQLSRNSLFPFYIKLKNISEAIEINIDLVFNSYSSYNNDRVVVVTDDICHNNSYFIGPLSEKERDVVGYLRINKNATLDDIVSFIGGKKEELRKTMNSLYAMRIIKKKNDTMFMPV